MKSVTAISGTIALKIWILSLIVNTIGGACLLAGLHFDFFEFAIIGGFFGLIFSFPVFVIIWIVLYFLFKRRYSCKEVFTALLIAGCILAAVAYVLFSFIFLRGGIDGRALAGMAIVSGATGIMLSHGNIKRYCTKREEQETVIEQIGQQETYYNF
ncbi:MAG: hypothetical protein V4722_00475 [Bacteroidota bacterium]